MKIEDVDPNLRTMMDGRVDRLLAKTTAEAIDEWCFDEWLDSLPKDLIVDCELLSLQFGIDAYTAQCLLNIWGDALEPVEMFENVDEGP